MCQLPPIDVLQEPLNSEIFNDAHNNMECNFVTEDIFDLMGQPVMDTTVISESEFDSVLKCLTTYAEGVDAEAEVEPRVSLRNVKSEPSENERSVTVTKKKIQCPSCPKEFISRLGFHKHFEKIHEKKIFGKDKEHKEESEQTSQTNEQNVVRPVRCKGKGAQNSLAQAPVKNHEQSSSSPQPSNNAKENVIPNVKKDTDKPVMKAQGIVPKPKKEKSAAPKDGSVEKRTTQYEEDSDPEFNTERLPTPGLESDNFFYRLGKEVQISFDKGKEKFMFLCRKCRTSCTRRADVRHHWRQACPENPNKAIQCKCCDSKKMVYGVSGFMFHLMNLHGITGEVVCLKCQVFFQSDKLMKAHVCQGVEG